MQSLRQHREMGTLVEAATTWMRMTVSTSLPVKISSVSWQPSSRGSATTRLAFAQEIGAVHAACLLAMLRFPVASCLELCSRPGILPTRSISLDPGPIVSSCTQGCQHRCHSLAQHPRACCAGDCAMQHRRQQRLGMPPFGC
jgi:hypothetical protein